MWLYLLFCLVTLITMQMSTKYISMITFDQVMPSMSLHKSFCCFISLSTLIKHPHLVISNKKKTSKWCKKLVLPLVTFLSSFWLIHGWLVLILILFFIFIFKAWSIKCFYEQIRCRKRGVGKMCIESNLIRVVRFINIHTHLIHANLKINRTNFDMNRTVLI